MLGDLLDNRYRIIRTLSKGGFGQTYIAEDTRRPGCPRCVMKHLKPIVLEPGHLNNARRLFQTEAIALEKLGHHPQIPRLLAYFEENNDFYLVQDLIRGYPLTKELKTGFKWLEADIYQLLYDVLSILIFVHDRGVIHRDIKPDNIIRRQLDRALVLVDFGSVKQIRTHLHPNQETGQTISIGTIGYMSTEQAHGRPRPNSDLYSLGIIGIQAATGIKPKHFHEDGDTGELVWRHQANISDGLASFLEKMVAYHFKDRYLDARAALRALKQIKPDSSPRHRGVANDPLLDKPSPWSLTASRLASAITSLKPALNNTAASQPTFIELPEPTEVSVHSDDENPLEQRGNNDQEEVPQTLPMAYVTPLVNPGNDATTADFEEMDDVASSMSMSMSPPFSPEQLQEEESVLTEGVSKESEFSEAEDGDNAGVLEVSRDLPIALLASDETLSSLPSLTDKVRNFFTFDPVRSGSRWAIADLPIPLHPMHQWWLNTRLLLWTGGGLGAIALALWGAQLGFQSFQDFREHRNNLNIVQNYYQEGRYLECQQMAQSLESTSETLVELEYQCALERVTQLVESGDWEQAINLANTMPGDEVHPFHNEAQILLRGQHFLTFNQAKSEGDINRVQAIAEEMDPNHPLQGDIQLARLKLLTEEKLWVQSLDLLAQGKWQEARERIRPLATSPYFQDRAEVLLKEADLNEQQTNNAEDRSITAIPETGAGSSATPSAESTPNNQ